MPSISQRIGTPNHRHNRDAKYRAQLDNVDASLTKYNESLRTKTVAQIYAEYLQPAFDVFNAKQKRSDRRLDVKWGVSSALEYQRFMDEKARRSKNKIDQKGRPPIREIIWQIGNPEQGFGCYNQTRESRERAKSLLLECQAKAEERYPQFAWGDLDFHADEVSEDADGKMMGSFHLHSSFVPICLHNKQGPGVQVAMERCLKEMGFPTFEAFKRDLEQLMEEVLEAHGMERTYMDNHEQHQGSSEFHRQQKVIRQTRELEKSLSAIQEQVLEAEGERLMAETETSMAIMDKAAALEDAGAVRAQVAGLTKRAEALEGQISGREAALVELQEQLNDIRERQTQGEALISANEAVIQDQTDIITRNDAMIEQYEDALQLIPSLQEYQKEADSLGHHMDLLEEAAKELPDAKRLFKGAEAETWLERMQQILRDLRMLIEAGIKRLKIYEKIYGVDQPLSEPAEQRAATLDQQIFGADTRRQTGASKSVPAKDREL